MTSEARNAKYKNLDIFVFLVKFTIGMKKRTRRIIFAFFVILFLTVAPLLVFYSMGWRFNWEEKKFTKPGMFYCKTAPRTTNVFLDNKRKGRTDIFFGSLLIENIAPGGHTFKVARSGYHSWEKSLEIKKGELTEAKNIVLIPENPEFRLISKNIRKSFFSTQNQKTIITELEEEQWSLKLIEADKNLKSHLVAEKNLSKEGADLISLKITPDGKNAFLKAGIQGEIRYFVLNISSLPASLEEIELSGAAEVYFHPEESSRIFYLRENELSEMGQKRSLKEVAAVSLEKDGIYLLDQEGFLLKSDYSLSSQEKITNEPFLIKKETKYTIEKVNSHIALLEGKSFYLLKPGENRFEKIAEEVEGIRVSPDSKKISYFSESEIGIIFLESIAGQPKREKGEIQFFSRFSRKIGNVFWYTPHYLIFNSGDKIKVSEIDNRNGMNSVDLAEFPEPEIFWYQEIGKLCLLSRENFFCSDSLIP